MLMPLPSGKKETGRQRETGVTGSYRSSSSMTC